MRDRAFVLAAFISMAAALLSAARDTQTTGFAVNAFLAIFQLLLAIYFKKGQTT